LWCRSARASSGRPACAPGAWAAGSRPGCGASRIPVRCGGRSPCAHCAAVADVDLSECRFAGAHNLDKLRIEGEGAFAVRRGWPRTARQILTEETGAGRLSATEVSALYRALRKGREDNRDGAGSGDFYYGEMEMRRRAAHELARHAWQRANWGQWAEARVQHAVLWLYWLVSGYALRAWRALLAFAVVVMSGAVLLSFWGFPAEPGFRPVATTSGALVYESVAPAPDAGIERLPAALRISVRSATALLRGPDRPLTPAGEWVETGIRLTGPVLLGLAVLSLRGRIRR